MGIATLSACFLRVTLPYYMQITQEINCETRMSKKTHKNTQENTGTFLETECKILHVQCRLHVDFHLWLKFVQQGTTISHPQVIFKYKIRMIGSLTGPATKLLSIRFHFVDKYLCSLNLL